MPGWEAYEVAQQLAAGHGYSFPYDEPFPLDPFGTSGVHATAWAEPFYTFLLAGLIRIFGAHHQLAAAVFNLVLLLLTLAFSYLLTERLLGPAAGVLTVVILGADASFRSAAAQMNGTLLATTLITLSALTLVACLAKPSRSSAVRLGLTLGLAALACPAAQSFIVVSAAFLVWRGRALLRRSVVHAAILVGTAALIILPWSIRNYEAFGEIVPVRTGIGQIAFWSVVGVEGAVAPSTLPAHVVPPWTADSPRQAVRSLVLQPEKREALENQFLTAYTRTVGPKDYSARNEAWRDAWLAHQAKAYLFANPLLSCELAAANLEVFIRITGTVGAVIFVLAVAGALVSFHVPQITGVSLWSMTFVLPFLFFVCCFARYREQIEPLLAVLATCAIFRAVDWAPAKLRSRRPWHWIAPEGPR
jgi:hypothetical protein